MHTAPHRAEHAGTSILMLGIIIGAAFLMTILGAVGSAYVAHAELQQAADLAGDTLESSAGDSAPRDRAVDIARANGARSVSITQVGDELHVRVRSRAPRAFGLPLAPRIEAHAWVEVPPPASVGDVGPNPPGQYNGVLAIVEGHVQACPRVASAYESMDAAARSSGVTITATSGFRTFAEQAILYARLGPRIAAPPGSSRHHDGTEFDINVGPAGSTVHAWLQSHGPSFGFIQRYSWEPWHWGYVAGC